VMQQYCQTVQMSQHCYVRPTAECANWIWLRQHEVETKGKCPHLQFDVPRSSDSVPSSYSTPQLPHVAARAAGPKCDWSDWRGPRRTPGDPLGCPGGTLRSPGDPWGALGGTPRSPEDPWVPWGDPEGALGIPHVHVSVALGAVPGAVSVCCVLVRL